MEALKTNGALQSLRSIVARHASARVLDLHTIALDCADDPNHRSWPMFIHPVLNRTIIAKHHLRAGDMHRGAVDGLVATKLIFPFDPMDLDLGGQYVFVHDPDLVENLSRLLDWGDFSADRDLAVLQVLDGLPTLDPFLLREALSARGMMVAPCYFRLSQADKTEMLDFVAHEVEALIALCFGGRADGEARAKRLSARLLAEVDAQELEPFRQTLRMEPDEFAQAMFCWKALLYYRWRSRTLAPDLKATRASITAINLSKFDDEARVFVKTSIELLDGVISRTERRIADLFQIYDDVFEAFTVQKTPEPFRRLLKDGPRLFARLGERMGRLEQVISFWAHQFPEGRTRTQSADAIFMSLRTLVNSLSLKSEQPREEERQARAAQRDIIASLERLRTSRRAAG